MGKSFLASCVAWGSGIAVACGVAAPSAHAQLVFGYPTYTYNLQRFDATLNAFVAPRQMSLEVFGIAADEQGLFIACNQMMYRWLYGAPGPTFVGTFSGAAPSICGGLAWDSTRQTLYGTGGQSYFDQSQLVMIDPVTCVTTLVRSLPNTKMGGLDFDGPRNRLLFTQNRSIGLDGVGLYALAWPYDTSAPTRLAMYPDAWQWDVEGVAVGGGYAWLVCDQAEWLYRYNLSTNQFESSIRMDFNLHDNISVGATWAPGMMDAVEHDLLVTLAAPGACTVLEGNEASLTATVRHVGGTQTTTGIIASFTLADTIDPDAIRSVPIGTWDAQGRWSVPLGTLAPNAERNVVLTIDDAPPGEIVTSVSVIATQADPRPTGNAASATMRVRELAGDPANGVGLGIQVLGSTVMGDSSSLLAHMVGDVDDPRHHGLGTGLGAAQVIELGVDGRGARGLSHSPDGAWVLAHATLSSGESLLLRFRSDGSEPARIIARTGVGPMLVMADGSFAPTRLESAAVNDAGLVALAMQANTTAVLARIDDGGVATVVLEEGATALAAIGPGAMVSSLIQSPVVGEFGQLACVASISGVPSSVDRAIFADDGTRVVAQEGVTLPWGQFDASGQATSFLVRVLDEGVPGLRLSMDAGLSSWIAPGAIAASQSTPASSGVDRVLMQGAGFGDASVVAQENVALGQDPGAMPLADLEPLAFGEMDARGTWWAGVRRLDGTSAMLRHGTIIAQSGDAAWPDGPAWASSAQALDSGQGAQQAAMIAFSHAPDAGVDGPMVLVGHVESSSPRRDGVAVIGGLEWLGGFGVLLRENELIMGEGGATRHVAEMFAGGASVSLRDAVLLVSLRDRDAAEGCAADVPAGVVLVRVPIASACPRCAADYDDNGGVDGGDLAAFFADFEAGGACADVDENGGVDGGDLGTFFQAFEQGGC